MRLTGHPVTSTGVRLFLRGFKILSLYHSPSVSLPLLVILWTLISLSLFLFPSLFRTRLIIRPVINRRIVKREFPCVPALPSFPSFPLSLQYFYHFISSFRSPGCDAMWTKFSFLSFFLLSHYLKCISLHEYILQLRGKKFMQLMI